jgi:hypothetical protein
MLTPKKRTSIQDGFPLSTTTCHRVDFNLYAGARQVWISLLSDRRTSTIPETQWLAALKLVPLPLNTTFAYSIQSNTLIRPEQPTCRMK